MKWRTASISLTLITLSIVAAALARTVLLVPRHSDLFNSDINHYHVQLGYYDLLSKKAEIYNPWFEVSHNSVILKLYNPDDNRLPIKINMTLKEATPYGLLYDFHPVYLTKKRSELLVSSLQGALQNGHVMLDLRRSPQGKMIVISSGLIINHI